MQAVLLLGGTTLLWYLFRRLSRRGPLEYLPGPPSSSFLKGNLEQLFDRQGWDFHLRLIQNYGSVVKLSGMFNEPLLYVFDPEALQHLFVREPGLLDQAEESSALFRVMFGPGMVAMPADVHRKQRRIVGPAFSLDHLRSLVPMFYAVTQKLCYTLDSQLNNSAPTEVDMLYWLTRVSLELIGQGGLGYSFDSLTENRPDDQFGHNIKGLVVLQLETPVLRELLPLLARYTPHWFPRWFLQYIPHPKVQEFARLANHINRRSVEIYQAKKRALEQGDEVLAQQVGEGRDIMSLLMRANDAAAEKDKLPEDEIVGQLTLMVAAGTDTSANATARLIHYLALRPDVQDKLRQEILEAGAGHHVLPFDVLIKLPWLDAVIKETLRRNSPGPFPARVTVKDAVLPLSQPIHLTNGTSVSEILVEKGTKVFVGVYGSNLNKNIWGDDALEWKPERWLGEVPAAAAAVPGVYANLLTFVAGPRACIGFKYAELEIKVITAMLVSRFVFDLTEKPIYWNMSEVCFPSVTLDGSDWSLPLTVTRYR